MTKYINVDKIRNAIESEADNWQDTYTDYMRDNLLTIIDSLQQEPPSIPDLDETAEKWCKDNNKGIALCADKKSHYLADGMDAFKAGAEWAIQQFKGKERR